MLGGCDSVDVGVVAVTWAEEAVVLERRKRRAQRRSRVYSRIDMVGLWVRDCLGGVLGALFDFGMESWVWLSVQAYGFRYMFVVGGFGCWMSGGGPL